MKNIFSFLKYLLPAFMWAIFILVLTTVNNGGFISQSFLGLETDKWGHLFMFSILVFFIMQGLIKYWRFSFFLRKIQIYAIITAFIYGLFIELIQYFYILNRTAEFWDIVANLAGCIIGLFLFKSVYGNLKFLDKDI
ncbi:MAG: VanZ family protein [Candidatus Paceibacterota bacterium]